MTTSIQTTNCLPNTRPINDCDGFAAMFESSENQQKLEEEIAYAKKLEAFFHKKIVPGIDSVAVPMHNPNPKRNGDLFYNVDGISYNDFHGFQKRIFTCIDAVDGIIERYNKNTDHVDLLLDLITRENQIFTDVLYNGTQRGNLVRTNLPHLDFDHGLTVARCETNALATTYEVSRDS